MTLQLDHLLSLVLTFNHAPIQNGGHFSHHLGGGATTGWVPVGGGPLSSQIGFVMASIAAPLVREAARMAARKGTHRPAWSRASDR